MQIFRYLQQSKRTCYDLYEPEVFRGNKLKFITIFKHSCQNPIEIGARTNIKVMIKLSWKTDDIIGVLRKVYSDNFPKINSGIYKWIVCFKRGCNRFEGNEWTINISL